MNSNNRLATTDDLAVLGSSVSGVIQNANNQISSSISAVHRQMDALGNEVNNLKSGIEIGFRDLNSNLNKNFGQVLSALVEILNQIKLMNNQISNRLDKLNEGIKLNNQTLLKINDSVARLQTQVKVLSGKEGERFDDEVF